MAQDFDASLLSIFLQEAGDHLSSIEPDLLSMEKEGEACSSVQINRVFRAIHTIKGSAAMLDLVTITSLSHAMENVLSKMRDKTVKPSQLLMDLLFQCIDKLKAMIDDIGNAGNVAVDEEVKKLAAFQENMATEHAAASDNGLTLFADEIKPLVATTASAAPTMVNQPKSTPQSPENETIRVKVDLLNSLMNTAGELVLGRNQLLSTLRGFQDQDRELATILQNIDRITSQLQEEVMQTRMQPIGSLFGRFGRMVRDLAKNLGKEIELITEGGNVELDKSIIELLADPLTHIIRNSADHGLETGDERSAKNKARKGTITLKAFHEGGRVHVVIGDDGRGINPGKVLAKAIEKGLVDSSRAKLMSEKDVVNLVFAPGFSTAAVVSEVSGRGVGMDVVRTNIEKLGGSIEIQTVLDSGTTVVLSLPLTVAIIPALIVGASSHLFAVPQVNLVELVCVKAAEIGQKIVKVAGAPVFKLRGKLLPVVKLAEVLGMEKTYFDPISNTTKLDRRKNIADRREFGVEKPSSSQENAALLLSRSNPDRRQHWRSDYYILVLRAGSEQFGLIVDELFDSQEVVVKPIASFVQKAKCFAGATILGNGQVILIIDAPGIVRLAQLKFADRSGDLVSSSSVISEHATKSIILFRGSPDEVFAVPQEKILRIEKIEPGNIQTVGQKEYVNQSGRAIEVLRLDAHLPVLALGANQNELFLILPRMSQENRSEKPTFGILASDIIDAVDAQLAVQKSELTHPSILGQITYNEKIVLYLDPLGFVQAVPPSR